MDSKEIFARLTQLREFLSRNIKDARRENFIDGNVNAAEPCATHMSEGNQVVPAFLLSRAITFLRMFKCHML